VVAGLSSATRIAVTQDASGNDRFVIVSAPTSLTVFLVDPVKGLVFQQIARNNQANAAGLYQQAARL